MDYDVQFELIASMIADAQPDLSREDIEYSMRGFVQRIKSCLGYKPEIKHRGDILFLRASHGTEIMSAYGLKEDYGLKKVSI